LPEGEQEIAADEIDRVPKRDAATVVGALQEVDETFRAPLTLFYLEDLSYLEIADALEVLSRTERFAPALRARREGVSAGCRPSR
jgi:RNA polymerase sigma-70 factor (ECF subfamily)